jgi:enoyl-CoA hydratase/carnithine racemase
MSYEQITFEVDDPVAIITLNRPEQLNAWTQTMANEVRDAIAKAEADPHVVGIVLTGNGKGFCAGADMKGLAAASGADGGGSSGAPDVVARTEEAPTPGDPSFGDDLRGTYSYFMSVPKPIVAAINGAAVGAGLDMALACDLRLVARSARLSEGYIRVGLVPGDGGCFFLPQLVGLGRALDLLMTGRFVDADEAERIGLVTRVVDDDQVLPEAQGLARRLATLPTTQLAMIKRATRSSARLDLRTHLDLMSSHLGVVSGSPEVQDLLLQRRP